MFKISKFIVFLLIGIVFSSCNQKPGGSAKQVDGMVFIPAGDFIMGTDEVDAGNKGSRIGSRKPLFMDEHPKRKINLQNYYIDIYETTNEEYMKFVQEAAPTQIPFTWKNKTYEEGTGKYPVTGITWFQAYSYCKWVNKRLPTEEEWEKASRGPEGFIFPWGNEFNPEVANTGLSKRNSLAPVGSYEQGKSQFGVYDMVGNVWEWTNDWYKAYPGNPEHSSDFGEKYKVLRGGGWGGGMGHYAIPHFFRNSHRFYTEPYVSFVDVGVRCAKDAE